MMRKKGFIGIVSLCLLVMGFGVIPLQAQDTSPTLCVS